MSLPIFVTIITLLVAVLGCHSRLSVKTQRGPNAALPVPGDDQDLATDVSEDGADTDGGETSLALPLEFTTVANDGFINARESSEGKDLIVPVENPGADKYLYAVAFANSACTATVSFQPAIPKSNDPFLVKDGAYKVCAAISRAGSTTFAESGIFILKRTLPGFTRLLLSGAGVDGFINVVERAATLDLVSAAEGTHYTTVTFALSTKTCDANLNYSDLVPSSNDVGMAVDGTYRICVQMSDTAGNPPAYGASPDFIVKTSTPGAFLLTAPVSPSRADPTTSWAASTGITGYRLKVARDIVCSDVVQLHEGLVVTSKKLAGLFGGTYYLCLSAVDIAQNETPATNSGASFVVPHPVVVGKSSLAEKSLGGGLGYVAGIASDGTRLFVGDANNARVLIWNQLPESNNEQPDVVVGQPDLDTVGTFRRGMSTRTFGSIRGVAVAGGKLFTTDWSLSRVLIWNTLPTTNDQPADVVLGQPDFTSSGSNSTGINASSLARPNEVASDGTHLVVADYENNRVLIWNSIPTSNGQPASVVLGQPDFATTTANNGGVSAQSLFHPWAVAFAGSKLLVTDYSNNRVLIWNTVPTVNQQPADIVIGQTNMTSAGAGLTAISLNGPAGISVSGSRLTISDNGKSRVMIWNNLPTGNGSPADTVLGQVDFTTFSQRASVADSLYQPRSVLEVANHLYVSDAYNNRIVGWRRVPSANGEPADFVLGQKTLTDSNLFANKLSSNHFDTPRKIMFDGQHLVVADYNAHRVLIWNSLPSAHGQPADIVLGQSSFNSRTQNDGVSVSGSTLFFPRDVFSDGTRLIVADAYNHRVLIWSTFPTASGVSADIVVGQSNLTSKAANSGGISNKSLLYPSNVHFDGTRLIVSDTNNNRVLIWNSMPASNFQPADLVLGQANFTSNIDNSGGVSAQTLDSPFGVFSDGTRLVVADGGNYRTLIWNSFPVTSNQAADLVIGQTNFVSNGFVPGLFTASFFAPDFVQVRNGSLYVSDSQRNRILGWSSFPSVNGQSANEVFGQRDLVTASANAFGNSFRSLYGATGMEFDNTRTMLADNWNQRVVIVPQGMPDYAHAVGVGVPTGVSAANSLTVSVAGASVTAVQYKYKWGASNSVDCANDVGYSSATMTAVPLAIDLSNVPDGDKTLCILTATAEGVWQPPSLATSYTWNKAVNPSGNFSITTPTPGATSASPTQVSWTVSSGAASYDIKIAFDWSCEAPVKTFVNQTGLSISFPALPQGTYVVCAFARTASGALHFASNNHLSFTVDSVVPGAFTITGPVAAVNSLLPVISWTGALGSWSYDVYLSTTAGCSGAVETATGVAGRSYQVQTSLIDAQTYYVCVNAKDEAGNSAPATNNDYVFTIDVTPPGAFSITGPTTPTASPVPVLTWSAAGGATNYDVALATEATCSAIVYSASGLATTSQRVDHPLVDGAYYACISSRDAAQNVTVASNSPYFFTVTNGVIALGRSDLLTTGSENGLHLLRGISSDGTRLLVADSSNHRVLIWNTIPASTNTPPDVVVGQPDFTTSFGGTCSSCLNTPYGVYSDGTRLYVADFNNSRVLIWNSIPTSNGVAADIVLGQATFNSSLANNGGRTADSLSQPKAVFTDGTKLYVADSSNHRVLIWNTIPTVNRQPADLVLGQGDMVSGTVNRGSTVNADTLNSPAAIFSDVSGLYVSDSSNHRVLRWDSAPAVDGQAADFVLGQTLMTTNSSACTPNQFSLPHGIHRQGGNTYIADYSQSRVMVWTQALNTSGQAADLVIGQIDFNSCSPNHGSATPVATANTLHNPFGVVSAGSNLFVSDMFNGRLLGFNPVPVANDGTAAIVIGQTTLSERGFNGNINSQHLTIPRHVTSDGTRLFVNDAGNNRVLIWNSLPGSLNQAPDFVVGQSNFTKNVTGAAAATMNSPFRSFSDSTHLLVADSGNHRVSIWNTIPGADGVATNVVLGQPSKTSNTANVSYGSGPCTGGSGVKACTLSNAQGVFSDGTRVIVTDTGNNRVLIWNSFPASDGTPADIVVGQPNMSSDTSNNGGLGAASLDNPRNAIVVSGRLYVSDYGNARVLVWNSVPTTNFSSADFVLGQANFTTGTVGTSATKMVGCVDLSSDGVRLVCTDLSNHRILVWDTLPTQMQQPGDFVLGQFDMTTSLVNSGGLSGLSLQTPWGAFPAGGYIYVADTNNNRILKIPLQ